MSSEYLLMVLTGGSVAVVGSWLPGGGGYGFVAVVRTIQVDGLVGLAARRPAMTRLLIERRDLNRRIRTRQHGYLPGSTYATDWTLFWQELWAGIDAGKAHQHCVVIDADGNRLLSQRVPNDEPALLRDGTTCAPVPAPATRLAA